MAPVGPINRNKLGRNGVISPLYMVFRAHDIDTKFLEYYFKTTKWHRFMKLNGDSGARFDRFTIGSTQFMKMPIPYPIIHEQILIGKYFEQLDNLITLHQRKIQLYNRFMTIVWEQRKLEDEVQFYSGLTYSPDDVLDGKGTLVLRSSNVKNGEIVDTDNVFVNSDIVNSNNVKRGDIIVVVRNGSRALIGKHAQIKEEMDNTVIGAFMTGIRTEQAEFINALLDTSSFDIEVKRNLGATINQITGYMFSKMTFLFPNEKYEQAKIGQYFSKLDQLITLHQWKWYFFDKKVGNAWEQRKFGDLYEKINDKNDLTYGTDKIISVANMYFKDGVLNSNENYLKTYNVFKVGDIAFEGNKSKNFSYGRFVENTIGDGIVSHVFKVFRPKMEYDLQYWKYAINNEQLMGKVLARCTKASTMMTDLVDKDFLNEKFLVPDLAEQQKVGSYFEYLDKLITLHRWKWFVYGKIREIVWIQRKPIKILVIQRKYTLLRVVIVFEWIIICCVCFENIQLRFITVIEFEIFCIIVDEYVVLIVIEYIYVIVVFEFYYDWFVLLEFVLIIKSCYVFLMMVYFYEN